MACSSRDSSRVRGFAHSRMTSSRTRSRSPRPLSNACLLTYLSRLPPPSPSSPPHRIRLHTSDAIVVFIIVVIVFDCINSALPNTSDSKKPFRPSSSTQSTDNVASAAGPSTPPPPSESPSPSILRQQQEHHLRLQMHLQQMREESDRRGRLIREAPADMDTSTEYGKRYKATNQMRSFSTSLQSSPPSLTTSSAVTPRSRASTSSTSLSVRLNILKLVLIYSSVSLSLPLFFRKRALLVI